MVFFDEVFFLWFGSVNAAHGSVGMGWVVNCLVGRFLFKMGSVGLVG